MSILEDPAVVGISVQAEALAHHVRSSRKVQGQEGVREEAISFGWWRSLVS